MVNDLKLCEQQKYDCACITQDGFCKSLSDTHFAKKYSGELYKCPFHKTKEQVMKEAEERSKRW